MSFPVCVALLNSVPRLLDPLLMPRAAILYWAVSWELASTLSFPMKHNMVEMSFDGQPINLFVDSASFTSYLIYGGWYESIYGPNSCKDLASGCYFCPPTDPCDLDSLRTQKIHSVMYAEGREDEFVLRRVSLWVGKRKVENIEIGLMVGSTRIENGAQPLAMLGPAHLTHETDAEVDTPSLIGQLVNAGVISQAAFSVHASELYVGINGRLVLGEDLRKTRNLTFFPLTTASWTKSPSAIAASAVRVWVPSAEDEMMEFSHEPQDRLELIIDTGADATVVPKKVFSMIWEALEWELGDDRTANRSELFHSIQLDEVDAFVDINGWIWFHTSVMDYLPVIAIDVDTDSTLEMHLSQHVQVCKGEWCRLLVTDKLPFDKAVDVFILGCPFFTEHDVHVDFNRGVAGFAAPEEPVVNTITSLETWNRIHRPLCRRRP